MNGEFQELYKAIKKLNESVATTLSDVVLQRHKENLVKFEKIFDRLDRLPCDERRAFTKYFMISNMALWGVVAWIVKQHLVQ